jgi:hypothetical protein
LTRVNGRAGVGAFSARVVLGAVDSGTVVTAAIGARYRFNEHIQLGLAYERSITDREDLLNWRLYADLVIRY